jgi:DNA-binding NarL/FixJ family response regulator
MRLDFNALWVDDQPNRVAAQAQRISAEMKAEGFSFQPRYVGTLDQIAETLRETLFVDEIDLVLVDWDLGENFRGQDAIRQIRERLQYREVVFYSAQTTPEELRKYAFEAGLEGIYCAQRDGLVEEVVGVFESLVKKVLDLDHSRGIVMGATSDIDYIVTEALLAIHDAANEEQQVALLEEARGLLSSQLDRNVEGVKNLLASGGVREFCSSHQFFTAYDRLRVLSRLLKEDHLQEHAHVRPSVTEYMDKVVRQRNVLGHQVLVPKGKPQTVAADAREMTLEEIRELRRLILGLRDAFRGFLVALRPS